MRRIFRDRRTPALPNDDPRVFDAAFYLRQAKDLRLPAALAEWHYMVFGWTEGRDPSENFSTRGYLALHADVAVSRMNPLVHYRQFGHAEGREVPAANVLGDETASRIAAILAQEAAAQRSPGQSGAEAGGSAAARLIGSSLFHAGYCRAMGGQGATRADLVADWLSRPPGARPCPCPWFDPVFYAETWLAGTGFAREDPFQHYVLRGAAEGLLPNQPAAERDIAVIAADPRFDRDLYLSTLPRQPRHDDPVRDHVLGGWREGGVPARAFDSRFVLDTYMRPRGIGGTPFAWYLRNAAKPWVAPDALILASAYRRIAAAKAFDPAYYAAAAGIPPDIDPVLHYMLRGAEAGLPTSEEFHGGRYLETYSDLASLRTYALLHYENNGRAEGRIGSPASKQKGVPRLIRAAGGRDPVAGRPAVIVVSHEASFTGAPIVALNIARALAPSHEVITWLGRDGPLGDGFHAASVARLTGFVPATAAEEVLAGVSRDHAIRFAIVNSAISGQVLEALRRAGIASVFLVHDFATYVAPRGSLSRMVFHADLTVFPANIVADAVRDEMDRLGLDRAPGGLRIVHQGWNGAGQPAPGVPEPQDIRARLGIAAGDPAVRVVFGGGWVQPRKGVDLFLQTAARLVQEGRHDWRFIWVGGNYRPDEDMLVSTFLADHVAKAGLSQHVFFWDEQPDLESFWQVADVFFLSSRLDPFPNIALDAIMRDVPVVCFDGATGIADLAPRFPFAVRAVAFSDPYAAAAAISDFAAQPDVVQARFDAAKADLAEAFSFETYVTRLLGFGEEARAAAAATAALADRIRARPQAEVAALAAAIPPWARLTPQTDREGSVLGLAALITRGGPVPECDFEPRGPLERRLPAGTRVRIAGARALDVSPGDWAVHLHVPDGAALKGMVAPAAGVPLLLSSPFGPALADRLPEGLVAEVLAEPAHDPFQGLRAAVARVPAGWLSHADLGLGEAEPPALAPGFTGRALAGAGADTAMALPLPRPGQCPAAALRRFRSLGRPDPEAPAPPLGAALYAAPVLARLLEAAWPDYIRLRRGLDRRAGAALMALLLADLAAQQGLGVVVVATDAEG